MRHSRAVPALVLTIALSTGGCSALKATPSTNVQPPKPGVPGRATDVTGIYRSIHQGLLQLRDNGEFVLIVPDGPGPSAGRYTLLDGRLEVRSKPCGDQLGSYDVIVTGEQEAGKAVLNLSLVADPCDVRRRYLTIDPWVYANS